MLKAVVGVVLGMFLSAVLSWWWGRVLLPEVGLTAPGYWTWFWASLPVMIAAAIGAGIKELR